MKKLLFLSFFGLFLLACTTDEGDGAPFVTDVVMPPSSQLFAPGDEVTVAARGFEADDDIMLRIAWPLSQAALPEGYADGVWAVVTERTESDITFLAPGGYPASTTEVKLFRRGKAMTLGKISVSDGRPPEEPSLYGITQYDCDETGIDRIDLTTGDLTRIETLGVLRRMHCVVNTPGSEPYLRPRARRKYRRCGVLRPHDALFPGFGLRQCRRRGHPLRFRRLPAP